MLRIAFGAILLSTASASRYPCLNTKTDKLACDSVPANLKLNSFGIDFCCRNGSGDAPKFGGFTCECPSIPPATCVDDVTGAVQNQANMNCQDLVEKGCSKTLFELSPKAPKQLTVASSIVCPLSCGACTRGSSTLCQDDFDHVLQNEGADCKFLLEKAGGDCKKKLSNMHPKIPDLGLRAEDVCPVTCGACHKSEVVSQQIDGALTSSESSSSTKGIALIGTGIGLLALAAVLVLVTLRSRRQMQMEEETTITPTTLAQL